MKYRWPRMKTMTTGNIAARLAVVIRTKRSKPPVWGEVKTRAAISWRVRGRERQDSWRRLAKLGRRVGTNSWKSRGGDVPLRCASAI
jgi:hypothetical protein